MELIPPQQMTRCWLIALFVVKACLLAVHIGHTPERQIESSNLWLLKVTAPLAPEATTLTLPLTPI